MTSRPLVPRRLPNLRLSFRAPERCARHGTTLCLGKRIDDIDCIDDVGAAHATTGVVSEKRASRADAASSSNSSDLRCQIARPKRANARPIARKSSAYQHQHVLLIRLSTDLSLVHWDQDGRVATARCRSSNDRIVSGGRLPKPHSVATP